MLRQRREEIMKKTDKQQEHQILKIGQDAKRKMDGEERASLQQEFERNQAELSTLEQNHNGKQDAVRQSIVAIPSNRTTTYLNSFFNN